MEINGMIYDLAWDKTRRMYYNKVLYTCHHNLLENKEMDFKNRVINIQAGVYNGACTVCN